VIASALIYQGSIIQASKILSGITMGLYYVTKTQEKAAEVDLGLVAKLAQEEELLAINKFYKI
jgi:hypothetical protein